MTIHRRPLTNKSNGDSSVGIQSQDDTPQKTASCLRRSNYNIGTWRLTLVTAHKKARSSPYMTSFVFVFFLLIFHYQYTQYQNDNQISIMYYPGEQNDEFWGQLRIFASSYSTRRLLSIHSKQLILSKVGRALSLAEAGFTTECPRTLLIIQAGEDNDDDDEMLDVESLDPNQQYEWISRRKIIISKTELKRREHVKDHALSIPSPISRDKNCEVQHDWQVRDFPNCNTIHEQDLLHIVSPNPITSERISHIADGGFRDVWQLQSVLNETIALKTLLIDEDYDLHNYEAHRIDTVSLDRLSFSPYITDVYGGCVNSGLYEFGHGGSLQIMLFGDDPIVLNSTEKLIMGYHAAASLSAVHNTDIKGKAAISHTDIKPKQFIYVPEDGILKLTDFNRAKFLAWDKKLDQVCPFHFGKNGGKYRSPEEYNYLPETEKIDVYQLGCTLYALLTGISVYDDVSTKKVSRELVPKGVLPFIPEKYMSTTNPAEKALLEALDMCWVYDPKKRATARQVEKHLHSAVEKLGRGNRVFLY